MMHTPVSIFTCKDSKQPCLVHVFLQPGALIEVEGKKGIACVAVDDRPLRFYFGFLSSPAAPAACIFRQKAAHQSTKLAQRMHFFPTFFKAWWLGAITPKKTRNWTCCGWWFLKHPERGLSEKRCNYSAEHLHSSVCESMLQTKTNQHNKSWMSNLLRMLCQPDVNVVCSS